MITQPKIICESCKKETFDDMGFICEDCVEQWREVLILKGSQLERKKIKEEIEKIFDIYEYKPLDVIEEKIMAFLEDKK